MARREHGIVAHDQHPRITDDSDPLQGSTSGHGWMRSDFVILRPLRMYNNDTVRGSGKGGG